MVSVAIAVFVIGTLANVVEVSCADLPLSNSLALFVGIEVVLALIALGIAI